MLSIEVEIFLDCTVQKSAQKILENTELQKKNATFDIWIFWSRNLPKAKLKKRFKAQQIFIQLWNTDWV